MLSLKRSSLNAPLHWDSGQFRTMDGSYHFGCRVKQQTPHQHGKVAVFNTAYSMLTVFLTQSS
jgi:hypothetical protein